jgi:hypothetical protein
MAMAFLAANAEAQCMTGALVVAWVIFVIFMIGMGSGCDDPYGCDGL